MRTTIQTSTGIMLDPFSITGTEITIEDIAKSLSQLCRFQGHTRSFYSVAQHSVLVARQCPRQVQLAALLHDASEAYLCDLVTPLKMRPEFAFYREVEINVYRAICKRFDLPFELPEAVHYADKRLFVTESRDLMTIPMTFEGLEPYEERIVPLPPAEAESLFLRAFELIQARVDLRAEQ